MSACNLAMVSVHSCPLGMAGGQDTGGMNIYLRETALHLAKLGCRVDIFTRAHGSEHERIITLGHNTRVIHVEKDIDRKLPKEAHYAYIERYTCAIEDFRRSYGITYNLIHSHYWVSGPVGQALGTAWKVPHVVTFHTLGAAKNLVGSGEPETDLRVTSEKELANACHRVIAPTEREAETLVNHYGVPRNRIGIVPCGVNLELFQPHHRAIARKTLGLTDKTVILCVARIDPVKGLDRLIEAVGMIEGNLPELIIVGGDKHSEDAMGNLQQKARAAGVARHVTFMGRVEQWRLPLYYSAADFCIVPSLYESFGMVILEALACGTPVIATDVGIAREVLKQPGSGWLIPDNTPLSMTRTITQALKNPDSSNEARLSRRNAVSGYSWTKVTDLLWREYRSLLL